MEGYPKYPNTKADYENVKTSFPNQWKLAWQALLDDRMAWFPVRQLADGEAGLTDGTHRVVDQSMDGQSGPKWQEEYREDENAKIFRAGLTVADVQSALTEA